MAGKTNFDCKFQMEMLKKFSTDKEVYALQVHGKIGGMAFSSFMYGFGEYFRSISQMFVMPYDFDNDLYTYREEELAMDGYEQAFAGNYINVGTEKRKKLVQRFVTADGKAAWVAGKALEFFNENATFFVRDEFSPVLVMEGAMVRGLIYPYIMKK